MFLLGTFTPGFVALWLTGRESGRSGVAALLRRLIDWDVSARWYVFALSYIAVIKLIVALLHRATTGAWPRFGQEPWYLLLGVLWAVWHLPLFFVPEASTSGQSFPLYYLLQATALSVAMAWLYANTRGSLLPVMLMHAAVNNTKDTVPSADPDATNVWALSHSLVAWLTVALLWLCAGCFLLRMRKIPRRSRQA